MISRTSVDHICRNVIKWENQYTDMGVFIEEYPWIYYKWSGSWFVTKWRACLGWKFGKFVCLRSPGGLAPRLQGNPGSAPWLRQQSPLEPLDPPLTIVQMLLESNRNDRTLPHWTRRYLCAFTLASTRTGKGSSSRFAAQFMFDILAVMNSACCVFVSM